MVIAAHYNKEKKIQTAQAITAKQNREKAEN